MTVDQDEGLPIADAGPAPLIDCNNTLAILDGSASTTGTDFSYQWLDAGGNLLGTDLILEVLEADTYTLVVLDGTNGCLAESQVTVVEDLTLPTADAGPGQLLTCDVDMVMLDGSGSTAPGNDLTYQWINAGGVSVGDTELISVTEAGVYQLVVTGANGCTDMAEATVLLDNDIPVADAGPGVGLNCLISTVTLGGSQTSTGSTITYEWMDANGNVVATTPEYETSQPGIYTLNVYDSANDCSSTASVEVTESVDLPTVDPGLGGTLTCTLTEITLGGDATSTGPNMTYTWSDDNGIPLGSGTELVVTEPGTYTIEVENTDNGCIESATVVVGENEVQPIADPGPDGILTCLATSYTLDGSGSSSGPDMVYNWYNDTGVLISEDLSFEVAAAGTYTLVVTDNTNGCSSSEMVVVEPDANLPTVVAAPIGVLTCEVTSVVLDGSGSSTNSGNTDFEWYDVNGQTVSSDDIVEVTTPGIYTLVVTDLQNFCDNSITVEVLESISEPTVDAGIPAILTCDVTEVTLTGSAGNSDNLIYEWLNPNGVSIGNDTSVNVSAVGTYTLVVTNTDNGCSASAITQVSPDANLPTANAGPNAILNCSVNEVTLTGSGSANSGNLMASWTGPNGPVSSTDFVIEVTTPGIYTLVVTDVENGCTAESIVEVMLDDELPFADAGPESTLTCETTSVTLDGSGSDQGPNMVYTWFDEQGMEISNDMVFGVSQAGTYTLEVMNLDNGCVSEDQVVIVPDANLPTAATSAPNLLTCMVLETTLSGSSSSSMSGEMTYEWQDENNNVLSNEVVLSVATPGWYTLMVTDPVNGCVDAVTVEVVQDIANPTADAGLPDTLNCTTSSLTLTGTGSGSALSFEWFDDNMISISNNSNATVSSAGVYTLLVTNGMNGCTAVSTVEIVPDTDLPVADAGVAELLTCDVTTVSLNGSGSSSGPTIEYQWLDPQGQIVGSATDIEVSAPGVYTLVVSDISNDCVTQDEVLVDQNVEPPFPEIAALGASQIDCNVAFVVLDAGASTPVGNLVFDWSTSNGNIVGSTTAPQIEADAAGVYTVLVTNTLNGCTESTTFEVTIDQTPPVTSLATPPVLTCVVTQIELNGGGSSSNGNFSYNWTSNGNIVSGQGTLTPTVDAPGTYTLVVTNEDNGCQDSADIIVEEDVDQPNALAGVADELDCVTPSVTLSGDGSSQGNSFIYQWTGAGIVSGATGLSAEVNAAGEYQLLVTNTANGCTATDQVVVLENTDMPSSAIVIPEPPLCFGDPGAMSVVEITGGTPPYLYSVDGQNFSSENVFSMPPGSYLITIQDAIGCEYQEDVYIPSVLPVAVEASPDVQIQLGEGSQLQAVTNISASDLASILWTPAEGLSCVDCMDPYASPTSTTLYTVTVVNSNGCEASAEVRVEVDKTRNVYIPSAFSPNGDGTNDLFMIYADAESVLQINHFQVYSRWGEMVFQATNFRPNDPDYGWGGLFRDELMNPAVFVYWAEIEFVDGHVQLYKGDVSLLK